MTEKVTLEKGMTSREFAARLAPVDTDRLITIFNFLADHWYEFRLITGQSLSDGIDASAFHREVAAALKFADRTCPDCHHEHEGKNECSTYLGEEKFCHCESKVTA